MFVVATCAVARQLRKISLTAEFIYPSLSLTECELTAGLLADSFSSDAVKSGAYIYPIRGILYFVAHKDLWKPLIQKMIPTLGLASTITIAMFFFTYLPQLAVMSFTEGPLAPVSAALLVLSESSTLFNAFSKSFVIDEALVDTFDGVSCCVILSGIELIFLFRYSSGKA